jgi:hypothetical protein
VTYNPPRRGHHGPRSIRPDAPTSTSTTGSACSGSSCWADGRFGEAQEAAEDLWLGDRRPQALYQGLSSALTAVCARQRAAQGARQIADATLHARAFPRRALDLEFDVLLDSVRDFVVRGEGPILLRRQGGEQGGDRG